MKGNLAMNNEMKLGKERAMALKLTIRQTFLNMSGSGRGHIA